MKRIAILVAIMIAASLASVTRANAHPGLWYWSRGSAEIATAKRYHEKYWDVECHGYGSRIPGKKVPWLYKHFNCAIDQEYHVILHVTGNYSFYTVPVDF